MAVKPYCIVSDLDGTLAMRGENRGPYDLLKCLEDALNPQVADILWMSSVLHPDRDILIVTGREYAYQDLTLLWLDKHAIPYTKHFMRRTGDTRRDYIVKEEIYHEHIEPYYQVFAVYDDRPEVIAMWRRLGHQCFAVNDGPKADQEKLKKQMEQEWLKQYAK